jgi:hypothetical protein
MEIQKKALYNLKRMSWLDDKNKDVKLWEREDYRALSLETLFKRLEKKGHVFNRARFEKLIEEYETPEELAEDLNLDDETYLLFFEVWRKISPETQCFSFFCDELDHQIYLFDRGLIQDFEPLEDILGKLQVIIEENMDEGVDPQGVFKHIASGLANDLEGFLYDFISEQIDHDNLPFAVDLLEELSPCFIDKKWFTFLKIRTLEHKDPVAVNLFIRQLILKETPELEFNFELLSFLAEGGDKLLFKALLDQTIPLLETEEDFQDLIEVSLHFTRSLKAKEKEKALKIVLDRRKKIRSETLLNHQDLDLAQLKEIMG